MWCCTDSAASEVVVDKVPVERATPGGLTTEELATVALLRREDPPASTPSAPVAPKPRFLKVLISSARALRNRDLSLGGGGASDPYVVCEVPDKAGTKVQTPVVQNQHYPTWDFEAEVAGYTEGDSLLFSVWDKDTIGSESLGNIAFTYDAFKDGFSGEVLLEGNGKIKSYISVSISNAEGKFPPAPAPPSGFTVVLDNPPLGLDLDTLDEKFARVLKIQDGSKVHAYNKGVPPELQLRESDFICACNGAFGNKIVNKIREGGRLELAVRRAVQVSVKFNSKNNSFGMDLTYESERTVMNDILVRRLTPDGAAAACGLIYPGDRIIGAAGIPPGGSAERIMEYLQKAKAEGKADLLLMRVKACTSSGPVDVSMLTRMAKDDVGLLPQPANPKANVAIIQVYVRSLPYGGDDKSSSGHRYDSIPIANGMINADMSCQLLHYVHDEHAAFVDVCNKFTALVVRVAPGQIEADGGDRGKFDAALRQFRKRGIQVWPSPDVVECMGAKDAVCKVAGLNVGLMETYAYHSEQDFAVGFRKTMKFQPRVIKQGRGSTGEGVWVVELKSRDYCSRYGERVCRDDEVLVLVEASDNHTEEHTVAEFVEYCVHGRTAKAGTWASKGEGKYLEGGRAAGGLIVDQRLCPRSAEGELRYTMINDTLVGIVHKRPAESGAAGASAGFVYSNYSPNEAKFATLTNHFLHRDLDRLMHCLGLAEEPVPLWWTVDFVNSSPVGTPVADEKWVVSEFNCCCVGLTKCLAASCSESSPSADFSDVPPSDRAEAKRLGDLMGRKALRILLG